MEFQYQYRKADYSALYESHWGHLKPRQRSEYYTSIFWYMAVLGMGAYVAIKHDEVFVAAMFAVFAITHLWQGWSFERAWKVRVEEYANLHPESRVTVTLNDAELTEVCGGIRTQIPWAEFSEYSVESERLFLRYRNIRGLVIPLDGRPQEQRAELVAFLDAHGVPKKAVEATAS